MHDRSLVWCAVVLAFLCSCQGSAEPDAMAPSVPAASDSTLAASATPRQSAAPAPAAFTLPDGYQRDPRLTPDTLQADFNGDGFMDLALPIKHAESGKVGFAILHGESEEVYILGAGITPKNGLSDDLPYYDHWQINHERSNPPGLEEATGTDPKGELILENPSLQVEKRDLGGGQFYWDGSEYAYFHQTC